MAQYVTLVIRRKPDKVKSSSNGVGGLSWLGLVVPDCLGLRQWRKICRRLLPCNAI